MGGGIHGVGFKACPMHDAKFPDVSVERCQSLPSCPTSSLSGRLPVLKARDSFHPTRTKESKKKDRRKNETKKKKRKAMLDNQLERNRDSL